MNPEPTSDGGDQSTLHQLRHLTTEDETCALVTYSLYDRDGRLITCHLCGDGGRWTIEQEGVVFVCEHEPVALSRGAIRQLSSVPAHRIAAFEFVGLKKPLPASGAVPWIGGLGS